MNSEIEKLIQERKSCQLEINTLQGELNITKHNIFANKNSEVFEKIQKMKQEAEDLQKKIDQFSGIQSKISGLKQNLHEKEGKLVRVGEKIGKLEQEIFSYENLIEEKKSQEKSLNEKKEKFRETLEAMCISDDIQALIHSIGSQKDELSRLSKEISKITSVGADPYFLLTKSEQRLQNLTEELDEMESYYKPDLVAQMEEMIPLKEAEKKELIIKIENAKAEKQSFYLETGKIKEEIAAFEDSNSEKILVIKERQQILRTLEDENFYLVQENNRISKLQEKISATEEIEEVTQETIDTIRQEIYEIHKKWKTRENNYINGTRSIQTRITKLSSHIIDLKKEIRQALENISKIKKN